MSGNDYLWDGRGEPDAEVRRLETLLRSLRSTRPAPDLATAEIPPQEYSPRAVTPLSRLFGWRPLAAAAVLVLAVVATWTWTSTRAPHDAWSLQRLEGPSWSDVRVVREDRVTVGEWIDTRSDRVRLAVGTIGEVQLEPSTRVRLVDNGRASHRLSLTRGVMHATIWAPPRQFVVETPSAVAVDLGCRYTLEVTDDGSGVLSVEAGWVGIEQGGVRSLVPAGAIATTRAGRGVGTPHFTDASRAFDDALEIVDFDAAGEARTQALETVLTEARARDAFSLWHLLARTDHQDRRRVHDRLAALAPPPAGVTREGVLRGDQAMLDAWWDELGLGSAEFWRDWTAPVAPAANTSH